MLSFAFLLGTVIFAAEVTFSHQVDRSPPRIQALIVDLGSDVFVIRERAEAHLLRIGLDAFPELRKASKGDDIEIARRSQHILSQFELIYRGKENESVRDTIDLYAQMSDIVQKTKLIWELADPAAYPNGEGLRTLCRIARFDSEHALRAEAAKCLIASPPSTASKCNEWFQTLRFVFNDRDDEELLRLVSDYASLYVDLASLREEAEKRADALEKDTGTPVEYPVPFTSPPELRHRVMTFTDRLAAFQLNPENSVVQPGNHYDILLFHALAELQDGVGLFAERDRTLEAALAVRTEKLRSDNPLFPIDPLEESSFSSHYFVAAHLAEYRYRFHWARRHLQLVLAEGTALMRVRSYYRLWFIQRMLELHQEAISDHQRCIEWLESDEFRKVRNNINIEVDNQIRELRAAMDFCLAKIEADAGNWRKAKEAIDRSLQNNPVECDAVILRYEISKHLDNINDSYHQETKNLIEGVLNDAEARFRRRDSTMSVATICNQAAWLLANTDGDFPVSLELIRIAIKAEPESPMYLDTMAHVYALGKDYKKAAEVQKEAVRLAPEATALQLPLQRFRELVKSEH